MQLRTLHLILITASAITALTAAAYARFTESPPNPWAGIDSRSTPVRVPKFGSAASLPNFSSIVAESGSAVVNISVTAMTKVDRRGIQALDPTDPLVSFRRSGMPTGLGEIPIRAENSGFILSSDGLIMTTAQAVNGATEITVKLTDRREFKAKLVGIDKPTDLALLKIEAQDLPTLRIGDSTRSKVGDWVLAIGSPFGFENSATAGIISASARALPQGGYVRFLQTDVAVNPGNSGGPLFNATGEVIGINSQIYSRNGAYQGLSFAIPINLALKVEQQLVNEGKVSRGWLGVTVQDVNQALADSFGLPGPEGALVDALDEDGPAARAGLRVGDIILHLNGHKVDELGDMSSIMGDISPNSAASLEIWREGKAHEMNLRVSRLDKPEEDEPELGHNALGLAVRPLTHDESRHIGVASGLLVEQSVEAAEAAGIKPGDVVLALNGHPLDEAEQLRRFATGPSHYVALLIQRGNARLFIAIDRG